MSANINVMKRRSFLRTSPLLTVPLFGTTMPHSDRPNKAIRVNNGDDRYKENVVIRGVIKINCKVSGKDTNNDFSVIESIQPIKGGPAFHVHPDQDEWFHAIEGIYNFKVGNETFRLNPGDSLFAPRKVAHTFALISEGQGRLVSVYQPAGKMEDYYRAGSKLTAPTWDDIKKLYSDHGMEVVGPELPTE